MDHTPVFWEPKNPFLDQTSLYKYKSTSSKVVVHTVLVQVQADPTILRYSTDAITLGKILNAKRPEIEV